MRLVILAVALCGVLVARPGGACTFDAECYSFNPCFVNNRCQGGVCASDPKNCDDGDVCTDDTCNNFTGCVHAPYCGVNTACGDQMTCTRIPVSIGFPPILIYIPFCVDEGVTNCDDQTACTVDACYEPDGCVHTDVSCDDGNVCTLDECDPVGGCGYTPLLGCCNLDDECAADQCVLGAQCLDHACSGGTPRDCNDGDACTIDRCNPADGCGSRAREGFDGVSCTCERALPPSCAGATIPSSITRRQEKVCALIGVARAADAVKARRLLGRVGKQFKKTEKVARRSGKKVGPACAEDQANLFADGRARAETLRQGL